MPKVAQWNYKCLNLRCKQEDLYKNCKSEFFWFLKSHLISFYQLLIVLKTKTNSRSTFKRYIGLSSCQNMLKKMKSFDILLRSHDNEIRLRLWEAPSLPLRRIKDQIPKWLSSRERPKKGVEMSGFLREGKL